MNESIGYTFQPQDAELIKRKMNGAASMSPLASRALQILSLRLPSIMGGRPLATTQLMTPNVGGNVPTGPAGPLVPGGGGYSGGSAQGPSGGYSGGIGSGYSGGDGYSGGGIPEPTFTPGAGPSIPGGPQIYQPPQAPTIPFTDPDFDTLDPKDLPSGNWRR